MKTDTFANRGMIICDDAAEFRAFLDELEKLDELSAAERQQYELHQFFKLNREGEKFLLFRKHGFRTEQIVWVVNAEYIDDFNLHLERLKSEFDDQLGADE